MSLLSLSSSATAPHTDVDQRYFALLQRWVGYARSQLRSSPDDTSLLYYGSGESGWGAQTVQKASLAFAVVATDDRFDPVLIGSSRDEILEEAVAMLRYTLATHRTGPIACIDQAQWGHSWISVLGLERAFPVFRILDPYFSADDRERIREILVSEAQWLVEHYPVEAGLVQHNRPEANLWNAAFLWKVAHLYPGDLGAITPGLLLKKVAALVRHGISTPASLAALDPAVLEADGPHLEANFFDSYALHHHRYLNIGYIAICLSQITLLHYSCLDLDIPEPEGWQRGSREIWELLRLMTFPDGRLGRVGGDTRVRYCYCQDYHMMGWHFAGSVLGDRAADGFYEQWVKVLELEMQENGDGAFLSGRCAQLRACSPTYYHRLESDRAVALALSCHWSRTGASRLGTREPHEVTSGRWADRYHGAYAVRSRNALMSWAWRTAEPAQGVFAPLNKSDLAEWHANLSGEIIGMGRRNWQEIEAFHGVEMTAGFATAGQAVHCSDGWVAEGQLPAQFARQWTACMVWGEEMIVMQRCVALRRGMVRSVKGVHLNVPNDIYNRGVRSYRSAGKNFNSCLAERTPEVVNFPSPSLVIDESITLNLISGGDSWSLHRPSERNIRLKLYRERDMLHNPGTLMSELVCHPLRIGEVSIEKGEVLYDVTCRLRLTNAPPDGAEVLPISEARGGQALPATVRGVKYVVDGEITRAFYFNAGSEPAAFHPGLELPRAVLSEGERRPTGELVLRPMGLAVLTAD